MSDGYHEEQSEDGYKNPEEEQKNKLNLVAFSKLWMICEEIEVRLRSTNIMLNIFQVRRQFTANSYAAFSTFFDS